MKKRQLFEKIFSQKISWMHFHRRFQCLTTSATSSKSMPPEEILPLEIPWQPIATILNGYNYLEVYARTKGSGSEQALAMAKGIWAVLSEGSKEFVLKYPCHAPHKKKMVFGTHDINGYPRLSTCNCCA